MTNDPERGAASAEAKREPPAFDAEFRDKLATLIAWRRDVRRFRPDPAPPGLVETLLDLVQFSPSVGNSQPWRFFRVESPEKRAAIRANFEHCNAEALAAQRGERAALYARLKLEGLDAAPVQLAVFCDHATAQGHGLGARTMPEALDYSVALMIGTLWLTARAAGLGLGWISILDPAAAARDLGAPDGYKFVAYLCIGWPAEEHDDPELVRHGWQARTGEGRRVTIV